MKDKVLRGRHGRQPSKCRTEALGSQASRCETRNASALAHAAEISTVIGFPRVGIDRVGSDPENLGMSD